MFQAAVEAKFEGATWIVGPSAAVLKPAAQPPTPPLVLRGLDCQAERVEPVSDWGKDEVGVDWLTGSFPADQLVPLGDYLYSMLGAAEVQTWGRFRYGASVRWHSYGVEIHFDIDPDRREKVHNGRATVVLPGSVWGAVGSNCQTVLQALIYGFGVRASRLDVAYDDFSRVREPVEILESANQGDYTGFRVHEPGQKYKVGGGLKRDMISFGARGSKGGGKQLCIYCKKLETKGARDCVRWELRLYAKRAHFDARKLADAPSQEAFAAMCSAIVGGSITFIDRKGAHVDRMSVLPWWSNLLSRMGSVVVKPAAVPVSVEKAKSWPMGQWATTYALLADVFNDGEWAEFHSQLLSKGRRRRTKAQSQALCLYRLDQEFSRAASAAERLSVRPIKSYVPYDPDSDPLHFNHWDFREAAV
jgi:hypothetical protein